MKSMILYIKTKPKLRLSVKNEDVFNLLHVVSVKKFYCEMKCTCHTNDALYFSVGMLITLTMV